MTDNRPSFPEIYLGLAEILAQRSTCHRLQVGTVISSTDFRKVLAIGYNGNATGLPNQCDRSEPGNCGCLHSEENAVINCDSPRDTKKLVFVTHFPCTACCKRLINLGNVQKVYYRHAYRSMAAKDIFSQVGIAVESIPSRSSSGEESIVSTLPEAPCHQTHNPQADEPCISATVGEP